jgi:hypothetical protein
VNQPKLDPADVVADAVAALELSPPPDGLVRMSANVRDAWIAKLRSGEVAQGDGMLHWRPPAEDDPPHLCCLGVLCELAVEAGVVTRVVEESRSSVGTRVGYVAVGSDADDDDDDVEYAVLPPAVVDWAGLRDVRGDSVNPAVDRWTLAELNDGETKIFNEDTADETMVRIDAQPFPVIARLIEEYL